MQENLDVLISYVLVIIGLSVFLQIIVEAIKNLLKLRWAVYENFLVEMYKQLFPGVSLREKEALSSRKERSSIGSTLERFKGFQKTINSLAEDFRKIRAFLLDLEHFLEETPGKDTTSVRSAFVDFRKKLLPLVSSLLVIDFDDVFKLYKKLFSHSSHTVSLEDLKSVQRKCEELLLRISTLPGVEDEILKLKGDMLAIIKELNETFDRVEKFIFHLHTSFSLRGETLLRDLENRYVRKINVWTFCIGLAMVFLLNADSIVIYRTLRDAPQVRTAIMKKADLLTTRVDLKPMSASINELSDLAIKIENYLEENQRLDADSYRKYYRKYKALYLALEKYFELYKDLGFDVEKRSGKVVPYQPEKGGDDIIGNLKRHLERDVPAKELGGERIRAIFDDLGTALFYLTRRYAALQLTTVEMQKRLLRAVELPLGWNSQRFDALISHLEDPLVLVTKILGLIITAVLISFGAPFWNDVLNSLLGLKSFLRKSGTSAGLAA